MRRPTTLPAHELAQRIAQLDAHWPSWPTPLVLDGPLAPGVRGRFGPARVRVLAIEEGAADVHVRSPVADGLVALRAHDDPGGAWLEHRFEGEVARVGWRFGRPVHDVLTWRLVRALTREAR